MDLEDLEGLGVNSLFVLSRNWTENGPAGLGGFGVEEEGEGGEEEEGGGDEEKEEGDEEEEERQRDR